MSTAPIQKQAPHSWYCPALGAFRAAQADVSLARLALHMNLPWLPLYAFVGTAVPAGWVPRAYFSPDDASYYQSRRTMPDKTSASGNLVTLYAAPGTLGNDTAGYVTAPKTGSSK